MKYLGINRYRRWLNGLLCLLLTLWVSAGSAQQREGISETALAELAGHAMSEFNVPGMAIGVVRSDNILISEGFGVREIGKPETVDAKTMFKIASVSKAFTTAALAVLVDEAQLSWDGAVVDYIPGFRMSDPWLTANFTVTDLLTHRGGLKSHVGDLLLWPEPNLFTAEDVIHALRYFEPVHGFRTGYHYDNLTYIVAGEIIPHVTGVAWGDFVDGRIMRPAGMQRCFAGEIPKKQMRNLASPHAMVEGELAIVERSRISRQPPVSAAAGGIVCSLEDMLTWVRTQLNRGTTPAGVQLFSLTQSKEMWKPHINMGVTDSDVKGSGTHFKAYGLGWRLADVHGFMEVSHTGGLTGYRAQVVLVPELELGVVVLTNGSSSAARNDVTKSIVRSFMPVKQVDWFQLRRDKYAAAQKDTDTHAETVEAVKEAQASCCIPDPALFTGLYRDPWFGEATIGMVEDKLVFSAAKSPRFTGSLHHHDGNRFLLRWTDRSLDADAWVTFEQDADGSTVSMSMLEVSEDGDWDFKDLAFMKVEQ